MSGVQKTDETPKRSASQLIQLIFNLINHILIIIVTIYMSYFTYNSIKYEVDKQLKIWHAFLCTIGVSAANSNWKIVVTFKYNLEFLDICFSINS